MADLSLIKKLRETTGAGMMDCKRALTEVGDDFEQAKDWLRKKGMAAAAKKSGRVAAEGLISIAKAENKAAMIELNSETDFVAKNEQFITLAQDIAQTALSNQDLESLKSAKHPKKDITIAEEITSTVGVIGENLSLRKVNILSVTQGVVASYVHNAAAENLGKIGVLVAIESNGDKALVEEFGKKIAMHIAASKPESLDINTLDQTLVEKEKAIFAEQARASGKPEEIIEKMVEGRISKFYAEVVLLEQAFVMDGKTKIKDLISQFAKDNNIDLKITNFTLFILGEGIEKEDNDFASEVAEMAKA
jgi:elongation factor Ts